PGENEADHRPWLLLDTENPAQPKVLGNYGFASGDRPLGIEGFMIYAGGNNPGLRVYDADSAGGHTARVALTLGGKVEGFALDGQRAYIAAGKGGLAIIDMHDPWAPKLVGRYPTKFACTKVRAQ